MHIFKETRIPLDIIYRLQYLTSEGIILNTIFDSISIKLSLSKDCISQFSNSVFKKKI